MFLCLQKHVLLFYCLSKNNAWLGGSWGSRGQLLLANFPRRLLLPAKSFFFPKTFGGINIFFN